MVHKLLTMVSQNDRFPPSSDPSEERTICHQIQKNLIDLYHRDQQHISCTHPRRRGNIERGLRYKKQANDGFRTRANFMENVHFFTTFPRATYEKSNRHRNFGCEA